MREEITEIIKKAKRSLKAAQKLYEDGEYDFSASRAYYTMFYMAEAVLLTKDLSFSKHSGVISAFGQHFVKSEIFDKKYQKMLSEAFEIRNIGDYSFSRKISKEEFERIFKNAEEFLMETEKFLKRDG
ncbi:MAG: HEPN domain-containing protein [Deltaproteobacteria bacterium]|jgi:uncharacterized protein (UPF0332 family)|nr:HEPN domain-containing protein [Deltaproteobacteria bacterium]